MKFKTKLIEDRFKGVHGKLVEIASMMDLWCSREGIEFCITEAWTKANEDAKVKRKSATHREKRAIDISIKGWSAKNIEEFIDYFDEMYPDVGAISAKDKERHLLVYGDDAHLDHIHCQLDRRFSL